MFPVGLSFPWGRQIYYEENKWGNFIAILTYIILELSSITSNDNITENGSFNSINFIRIVFPE